MAENLFFIAELTKDEVKELADFLLKHKLGSVTRNLKGLVFFHLLVILRKRPYIQNTIFRDPLTILYIFTV
jgi:hypothetical protein